MSLTAKLNQWTNTIATEHDIFFEYERTRQLWEPAYVVKDNSSKLGNQDEIDNAMSRAIALALELELPVGAFIRAMFEREDEIPQSARQGLIKNIEDEEKHYQAFKNISLTYVSSEEDKAEAIKCRKVLLHFKAHPLQKSRDLETILFIPLQSMMRYYGSQSLERVIASVSLDEYRHLQYNWELSEMLNVGFNEELENLIKNIAQWMFEPLKNTKINRNFWNKTTQEMAEDGRCEDLENLMCYGIKTAPFEVSNDNY